MKLAEAIAAVPAKYFPIEKESGVRKADYTGLFALVVGEVLKSRKVKFDHGTLDRVAEHVNLATFQRQVAIECLRRNIAERRKEDTSAPAPKAPKKAAAPKVSKKAAAAVKALTSKKPAAPRPPPTDDEVTRDILGEESAEVI